MAEEKVETELGPESKGLLARLADKLQQGKDATEELGAPLAAVTTAVDMSAMTVAAATRTGLSAVTSSLSLGFDLLKNDNLTTVGAISNLTSVMGSGLAGIGKSLAGMLQLDKMSFRLAQSARKAAKTMGDAMTSGISTAAKKVGGIAKSILDILLEGAFLLALWGLLKYLEGPGFKWVLKIFSYMKVVFNWIGTLFTDPLLALEQLWTAASGGIASLADWIWQNVFVALWDWFEELFPNTAYVIKTLWQGITGIVGGMGSWLWDTVFSHIWDWLGLLFTDPLEALKQLFEGTKNLGEWLWNNAILPVWNWFKLLFNDPKAAFVELFSGYLSMGSLIWNNAIMPLWNWFEEKFPGGAQFIKDSWAAFMSTPIGEWVYAQVIEPFTKWLDLAMVDPTAALDQAWTMAQ